MAKLVLSDVATGAGGQVTINANNAATEVALENTLSRDGTSPNMMGADIDMNGYCLLNVGCITDGPAPLAVDVQVFTAHGTWTKPAGAKLVRVDAVSGGGGGGSGRQGAPGSNRSGGGGGQGGGTYQNNFLPDDLTATIAVTVGLGGTGGTGQVTPSTSGVDGGNGGTTSFGPYLQVEGGEPGSGGVTTSGGKGSSGAESQGRIGMAGGVGSNAVGGTADAWERTGSTYDILYWGCGGGGAGGGLGAGNSAQRGGEGTSAEFSTRLTGIDATFQGQGAPAAGPAATAGGNYAGSMGVGGGGGGGASLAGIRDGAAGGLPGGGGGGGAASPDGTTSGAGGGGGRGIVVVTTFF